MCDMAVDLGEVATRHGVGPEHFEHEFAALAPMIADGVAHREGWRVSLPSEARPFLRNVGAVFDARLAAAEGRYSRAL
jgi:oxygen-independent coproporphyrinogen-3 oxidase